MWKIILPRALILIIKIFTVGSELESGKREDEHEVYNKGDSRKIELNRIGPFKGESRKPQPLPGSGEKENLDCSECGSSDQAPCFCYGKIN